MKVIKMISYDEARKLPENGWGGLGGFIKDGDRWKDYIESFPDLMHPYLEAFRQYIVENNIRLTGETHQNSDNGAPVFDDGTTSLFSYRAMGDLMAAIWAEEENKDYSYIDFYM